MFPKACWILCTPRTGSSLLCELLNNLGVFPAFEHPDLKDFRGPLERGQAFSEWPRLFSGVVDFLSNVPPYSKMIFHQYVEMMAGLPKDKKYHIGWYPEKHDRDMLKDVSNRYDSRYVCSLLPDISFLKIKRDVFSHAVSLYFARTTKKYHIYDSATLNDYMSQKINIDHSRLLEVYADALQYANDWQYFFKGNERILEVDYDQLVSNPSVELGKIVDFLGIQADVAMSVSKTYGENKRIFRMTRPEAKYFIDKLRALVQATIL